MGRKGGAHGHGGEEEQQHKNDARGMEDIPYYAVADLLLLGLPHPVLANALEY